MSFGFASKSSDKLLSGIVRFLFVKAAVSESTTVFHTHATDRRQCGVAGCGGATNPGAAASHLPGRCHPHRRSRLRPCDHHQPGLHDLSVHIAFGHAVERPAGACNAPQQRPLLIWQDRPALAIPANFACLLVAANYALIGCFSTALQSALAGPRAGAHRTGSPVRGGTRRAARPAQRWCRRNW